MMAVIIDSHGQWEIPKIEAQPSNNTTDYWVHGLWATTCRALWKTVRCPVFSGPIISSFRTPDKEPNTFPLLHCWRHENTELKTEWQKNIVSKNPHSAVRSHSRPRQMCCVDRCGAWRSRPVTVMVDDVFYTNLVLADVWNESKKIRFTSLVHDFSHKNSHLGEQWLAQWYRDPWILSKWQAPKETSEFAGISLEIAFK